MKQTKKEQELYESYDGDSLIENYSQLLTPKSLILEGDFLARGLKKHLK